MQPHRGAIVLVLGILSLIVCAPLGIAAWIMGKGDMAKMDAGAMDPSGRGLTQAGTICGIIGTVLFGLQLVIGVLWVVFAVIIGVGAAASGGSGF